MAASRGQWSDSAAVFPPKTFTLNASLLPVLKKVIYKFLTEHKCQVSYQAPLLTESGRLGTLTDNVFADNPDMSNVAPELSLAVSRMRALRFARLQWAGGLRSTASLGLCRPLPNGPSGLEACEEYINSAKLRLMLLDAITEAIPVADRTAGRFRVRIDIAYVMTPDEGVLDAYDQYMDPDRTVDDNGQDGYGNYFSPDSTVIAWHDNESRHAACLRVADDATTDFQDYIDHSSSGMLQEGSNPVLRYVLGAFVHLTPSHVASVGAGCAPVTKGIIPDNPAVSDDLCIARSIVTALDPKLHYRTGTSILHILRRAKEGAEYDVKHGSSPASVLSNIETEIASLNNVKYDIISEAAPSVRAFSRYHAIEHTLRACMSGVPPLAFPDLSAPAFCCRQPFNKQTFDFIRGVLNAVSVKANFWAPQEGGVGLIDRDRDATLSYLRDGGRIINLLVCNGHMNAMTNVTMLCHELARTNKHIYCDLCGYEVPRTTRGRKNQRTLLFEHQCLGCKQSDSHSGSALSFTRPLTQANIRQLPMHSFHACYQLTLHCAASYWQGKHLVLCGRVMLPWTTVDLPAYANTESVQKLTMFLQRWSTSRFTSAVAHMPSVMAAFPSGLDTGPMCNSSTFVASDSAVATNAFHSALRSIFTGHYLQLLYVAASFHVPRDSAADTPEAGLCKFCKSSVLSSSRDVLQSAMACTISSAFEPDADDTSPDEDTHAALPSSLPSESAVLDCDPATGVQYWAHAKCNAVARGVRSPHAKLQFDVSDQFTLAAISDAVMRTSFIHEVCHDNVPVISRKQSTIRTITLTVPLDDKRERDSDIRSLTVCFRVASIVPVEPSEASIKDSESIEGLRTSGFQAMTMLTTMAAWAKREIDTTGLNPLSFVSSITYARTALLHSIAPSQPPLTSIVDQSALDFVNRVVKGGRLVTGSRVVWPELPSYEISIARLYLDFTAKYPDVLLKFPLPHQEHTMRLLDTFTSDVEKGKRFIEDFDIYSETNPICLVEVSGEIPPELHHRFLQFAPLFSRIAVSPSEYTPYQRMRLGMKLSDVPVERTVPHLFPIHKAVMFLREAKILLRLGFRFNEIGEVWGCHASYWARSYATEAEAARRRAQLDGDKASVTAIKLRMNSVIGSMNMNASLRTTLKSVLSSAVDTKNGLTVGIDRKVRLADDSRFTGRVFSAGEGDVTLIEFHTPPRKHTQMTAFALAVQAYARCDHLELMYGNGLEPGLFDMFPDMQVLYGNTDAVIFQIQTSKCDEDVRVELFRKMEHRLDLSNVPLTSTFWLNMTEEERARAMRNIENTRGKWGLLRDETGMAGISAFVVNGPNRYAYRVMQSSMDTLPEHTLRRDVLKFLPKAWTSTTTIEQYAHDWAGGPSQEECEVLLADKSLPDDAIPLQGTSRWGNAAAIVSEEGKQWPLGARVPEVAAAMLGWPVAAEASTS